MDMNNIILSEQNKVDLLAYFHALEDFCFISGIDDESLQLFSDQDLLSLALHDATNYLRFISLTTNKRN